MKKAISFLIFSALCNAAISADAVWEVRSAGNAANGGCFVSTVASPGTDFSQQDAAQIAYTDLVIGGTTTQYTSALNAVDGTIPGNCIDITGGAGCTTGRYYVVSRSGTTATVDRSMGTGASTCTANLGGAITYPQITAGPVAGNVIWVKADGNHNQTADTTFNVGSSSRYTTIAGYSATRGDNGRAVLRVTTGSVRPLRVDSTYVIVKNLDADCNGQANCNSVRLANTNIMAINVKAISPTTTAGFDMASNVMCFQCYVTGHSVVGFNMAGTGDFCFNCVAVSGTASGFFLADRDGCYGCISANNTGAGSDGFFFNSATAFVVGCTAYGNGRDGIRYAAGAAAPNAVINNCVLVSNTGYGINDNTGSANSAEQQNLYFNAFYSNTAGARNNVFAGTGDVTLTGNPFTNAAGNDFSLNSTAGAGADLKSVGFPGALALGGTGYVDIGALQAAAGAASATVGYPIQ